MKKNMGALDRILRIIVAVVLALLYFSKVVTGTLGIIFLVIALVFLLTSIIGFCPLYTIIGVSTRKEKA